MLSDLSPVLCSVRQLLMVPALVLVTTASQVTPGAYFVVSTPADHHHNRTSRWVSSPRPNECYRKLAATLGMRHEWIIIQGATANDNMTPGPREVAAMALRMCTQ